MFSSRRLLRTLPCHERGLNDANDRQYLVVDGNVFIERGPGRLNVTIGGQTASS